MLLCIQTNFASPARSVITVEKSSLKHPENETRRTEQINLMKKIQSPAEEKNNVVQTTDNDKGATNLIKLIINEIIN